MLLKAMGKVLVSSLIDFFKVMLPSVRQLEFVGSIFKGWLSRSRNTSISSCCHRKFSCCEHEEFLLCPKTYL